MDLSFLIDKALCIKLRNEVMDEMHQWGDLLSPEDIDRYYKIINQLTILAEKLN